MERIEFTVRGQGVHTLPRAIGGYPRGKRVQYDGDGFAVVATGQFSFGTSETTCRVAVFSGGGNAGLLRRDLGSESSEAKRIERTVGHCCEEGGFVIGR